MNKKRTIILLIMISVILCLVLGTTFSIFNFNRLSGNQTQIVLGDIYMSSKNENLTLKEIVPMDVEEGLKEGSKYKFSVEGYNTSSKDIYYGVYIKYGEEVSNKTRFKDEDLMINLTETINGETRNVYGPGSLKDFNDKLIYASTIEGETKKEEKVEIDYELTV